jgi:hypothetical protein
MRRASLLFFLASARGAGASSIWQGTSGTWNLDWSAPYVNLCNDCAHTTGAPVGAPYRALRGGFFNGGAVGLVPPVRTSAIRRTATTATGSGAHGLRDDGGPPTPSGSWSARSCGEVVTRATRRARRAPRRRTVWSCAHRTPPRRPDPCRSASRAPVIATAGTLRRSAWLRMAERSESDRVHRSVVRARPDPGQLADGRQRVDDAGADPSAGDSPRLRQRDLTSPIVDFRRRLGLSRSVHPVHLRHPCRHPAAPAVRARALQRLPCRERWRCERHDLPLRMRRGTNDPQEKVLEFSIFNLGACIE